MDSEETVVQPLPRPEPEAAAKADAAPERLLSVPDGVFLMVGMVLGVGIFKAPSIVAGNTASATEFLLAWLLGGAVSLCGALVYAELSARYPETGGEYSFLARGMGRGAAFMFAWSRMAVIQTGAIAAVAFVFGDYASQLLPLGKASSAVYAGLCVIALTALNIAGTLPAKSLQRGMETVLIAGLLVLAVAGLIADGPGQAAPAPGAGSSAGGFGLAMIFVLLTYGGWNEAAYLGGEVREARRNMLKILVSGTVVVTLLYLAVNVGYLAALGLDGMRESKAVAADVMRLVAGEQGVVVLVLLVCVSALTTINAAIFTGARTTWAFGQDFSRALSLFRPVGAWKEAGSTPANALLLQGAITLALVAASAFTPDGFSAMVAYTSPVFWTFFLLTGLTLFRFRIREKLGEAERIEVRVPLYPLVPLIFCAACAYMLWSSIDYVRNPDYGPSFGYMVFAGLAIMLAGLPLYWLSRTRVK